MAELVRITDVSPRDGLQNEPGVIATADKARLVQLLAATGVDEIEVTSFVSPKWIPQLGDAAELIAAIGLSPPPAGRGVLRSPLLSALVPNERGMASLLLANQAAHRTLIGKAAVFTSASETFSKKNTNATISETLDRFVPVIAAAKRHNVLVRGYISCIITCPFEGPLPPAAVISVAARLIDLGVDELDLGDTIGAGDPGTIEALLRACRAELGTPWFCDPSRFTLHLHDTFGRAADCVRAALRLGVRSFDGSIAGLGGCPYAGKPGKPAPGNISTELLVRTANDEGFLTGVDTGALVQAAEFARSLVAAARSSVESLSGGGEGQNRATAD